MSETETDQVARSVIRGIDMEFTSEEIELLIQDDRFGKAAYLYRLATRHATHEDSLEIDHRVRTELERAVREHAQRVVGQHEISQLGD